jgi:nucleoside-triphosphatase THEP1
MTRNTDRIAAVVGAGGADDVQTLFADVAARWRASGIGVVGVIAETHDLPGRTCAAGFLRDIASGTPYRIYLETPPGHTSCHLDAAGVEAACAAVRDQIRASDVVVLSKFGKLEAGRRGLADAFEAALAAGKPVLTTVSDRHRDALHAFAPDATFLTADEATIQTWRRAVCTR